MSTIKDVAKKANVSVTTVSRVLNKNGYVHHDTKRIIEEAMNELKYSPNAFAEGLSRGTTNIIGLIINYITDPNSSKIIDILEQECQKKRFKTIIGITRESKNMEDYYFNLFKKYNIDGLIIANEVKNVSDFISLNKPMVSIDHYINNDTSSIKVNYELGINLAVEKLIDENRNNILIIKYKNKDNKNTISFVNKLREKNITANVLEIDEDFDKEHLFNIISHSDFDGIYTTCDIIAISTVSILHKLKIKVPEMCSVIGSSNSSFSSIITPALTSIDFPAEKIATSAFDILYNNITKEENKVIHELIDINLIKRESTK